MGKFKHSVWSKQVEEMWVSFIFLPLRHVNDSRNAFTLIKLLLVIQGLFD